MRISDSTTAWIFITEILDLFGTLHSWSLHRIKVLAKTLRGPGRAGKHFNWEHGHEKSNSFITTMTLLRKVSTTNIWFLGWVIENSERIKEKKILMSKKSSRRTITATADLPRLTDFNVFYLYKTTVVIET